jgi:hypothetical protein
MFSYYSLKSILIQIYNRLHQDLSLNVMTSSNYDNPLIIFMKTFAYQSIYTFISNLDSLNRSCIMHAINFYLLIYIHIHIHTKQLFSKKY